MDGKTAETQNMENDQKELPRSAYCGVSWHRGSHKWRATIFAGSKPNHIGNFADEVAAAEAFDMAAMRLRGLSAALPRLNFPDKRDEYLARFRDAGIKLALKKPNVRSPTTSARIVKPRQTRPAAALGIPPSILTLNLPDEFEDHERPPSAELSPTTASGPLLTANDVPSVRLQVSGSTRDTREDSLATESDVGVSGGARGSHGLEENSQSSLSDQTQLLRLLLQRAQEARDEVARQRAEQAAWAPLSQAVLHACLEPGVLAALQRVQEERSLQTERLLREKCEAAAARLRCDPAPPSLMSGCPGELRRVSVAALRSAILDSLVKGGEAHRWADAQPQQRRQGFHDVR